MARVPPTGSPRSSSEASAGRPRVPSARTAGTTLFVGIDEAGLGPILGPLTLGWSAVRAPVAEERLWSALRGAVTRRPAADAQRLVVADSKEVFSRNPRGSRRLEATALGFRSCRAGTAALPPSPGAEHAVAPAAGACAERGGPTARELVLGEGSRDPALAPDPALLDRHPWYALLAPRLPVHVSPEELARRAARLVRSAARAGVEVVDAGVRVVPAAELNASFARTGSKGLTVWEKLAPILERVWTDHGAEAPEVVVDRQGGRVHYAELLERTFPWCEVHTRSERSERSEYELVEPAWVPDAAGRRMRVVFAERADRTSFCTALASCLAKYVRELCMDAFNAWFTALQPDLRPTAGYVSDARRWLDEARPALERAALPPDVLVRER